MPFEINSHLRIEISYRDNTYDIYIWEWDFISEDMQCPACLTLPESEGRNVRSVAPALQVALAGAAPADLAQPPAQTVMRDRARLPARLARRGGGAS